MPSDLPKVTAYIAPEAFEALDAAARALGQSKSRLVVDLITASVPMLAVITDAALVLQNANAAQREAMAQAASQLAPLEADAARLTAEVVRLIGLPGAPA